MLKAHGGTTMEPVETKPVQEVSDHTLAILAEIAEEINASLDVDKILAKTATLVKRLIDYEIFCVMLLDQQTQSLSFRFAVGYSKDVTEDWRVPVGQGIAGAAVAMREPVRVGNVGKDSRYIAAVDAVRSELAVPLMLKNQAIGVIDLQSPEPDFFTHEQQEILVLLASRLAVAIENARLFERARTQADTLLVLNEVGREASSILDVEALLRRAAELVKRVIDFQIMSIMLYDGLANLFLQRVTVKYGQSVQGKLRVHADEGIIGTAASTGQPVRVSDVTQDSRYRMVNPETRSELAIPMVHKGNVIGVLDLESPQLNYFTEDHVQALSILAAQLAVSLENARLYEQVARDEARMERELQAAQRMQGALLRPVPDDDYGLDIAARILSAREVCGDLYDFLRYGPTRLGVGLGDVSGKGSAAALYGAVAIGILRSLAPQKLLPAELLRQLNQLICERMIEGRFMTCCFATWRKPTRKLRVANAGQTQPLLYKAGHCEQLKLVGFPLGIYDDVTYEEWTMTLHHGDILVFHSDGLSEAPDPDGNLFGTARLASLIERYANLTAGDLADRLLNEVQAFTCSAPLNDDRTLVVMKVK
jgi:sigma-B regulation protein RsbU (phosphoserine phosphatase)